MHDDTAEELRHVQTELSRLGYRISAALHRETVLEQLATHPMTGPATDGEAASPMLAAFDADGVLQRIEHDSFRVYVNSDDSVTTVVFRMAPVTVG